jgi:hypothetical protein
MPLAARRFVYSLLTVLGFVMMIPLTVSMRQVQSTFAAVDPTDLEAWLDPALMPVTSESALLFLAGLIVASSFLYLALSTGYAKAWRRRENGASRCGRCGGDARFGLRRCPACDQQLTA